MVEYYLNRFLPIVLVFVIMAVQILRIYYFHEKQKGLILKLTGSLFIILAWAFDFLLFSPEVGLCRPKINSNGVMENFENFKLISSLILYGVRFGILLFAIGELLLFLKKRKFTLVVPEKSIRVKTKPKNDDEIKNE